VTPERWQKIRELFHAVLELDNPKRARYLEDVYAPCVYLDPKLGLRMTSKRETVTGACCVFSPQPTRPR